ncbi:MAG: NAD+ synthase, partial [Gemmatimonadaceae bacterium]|nr:NAD+ synthase [Gemmatimonadaceae bacterium]
MSRPLILAVAQFAPAKADVPANRDRIAALLADALAMTPRPHVLHLPETAFTGYFVEGGVRELAMSAGTVADELQSRFVALAPAGATLDVVVGFYETWRSTLYNSVLYVTLGGDVPVIRHVHRKIFLPTYGLFDEARFVEAGRDIVAFDTTWGRAAMLVCEDAWHSLTGTIAALQGAEVLFVSSAAPARGTWPRGDDVPGPSSVARWERLVRDIAEEHGIVVSLANLVGSEGGKMFSGASMVLGPAGDVRLRLPVFTPAIGAAHLDLRDLVRVRADMPLLADLAQALPSLHAQLRDAVDAQASRTSTPQWDAGDGTMIGAPRGEGAGDAAGLHAVATSGDTHATTSPTTHAASAPTRHVAQPREHGGMLVIPPAPVAGGAPPSLDIDAALVERWLVQFLRDELRRRGFEQAVIGLSGGVDSAVTTWLAAKALGPERVIAVRMPYRTSSPDSLAHAQLVIDALGVRHRTMEITAAVDGYLQHEPDADGARRGNVMARMRMITLFDQSARHRAVPLGTGNKTERLFGYYTWHADDSPPINPLGDLYKTQVWALARHLGVPSEIVDKPASADLVQGQTDEGDFGISYARADTLLNWLLHGWTPDELVARGEPAAEVRLVVRRLEGTHWKRRLPT